ncbi:tape measure protein [Intestinimonas butyriciproducens]|uniref:tape measure protein n=1 Tax=Intestinimonas butyriciproducens TaxID=1297617 RepID=UPI001899C4F4|nr:tape measure protein [Intestinimonas butyriciproducens]MDB7831926.1 tape measure protein [Intestinimonas butyriciproducens]
MPDVSIAISAQDSYSSAIKSMAQITKSFSKDMDEMEGKLSQLNKNRYSLKMDLREAQKKLSDAEKQFQKTKKAKDELARDDAQANFDRIQRNLALVTKGAREAENQMKKTGEAFRKVDNQGGSGSFGKNIVNALAVTGAGNIISGLAQNAANTLASSIGGDAGGALFSSALSSAFSGAAIGSAILPGLGTALGAAAGTVVGLISGGIQNFEKKDDAFKSYYGGLYSSAGERHAAELESGSGIASGRETDLISFSTLFGSRETANTYLSGLVNMANTTPFLYDDLTAMSKTLATFGYDAKSILPVLSTIGDAGAALGMSTSDMTTVAQALGRMKSSDKATLEYLNILNDRGIGAVGMLAEAKGKSQGEIYDMISKGQIAGTEAVEIILSALTDGFSGAMEEQSKTFAGRSSTLEGWEQEMANAQGEAYNTLRSEGKQRQIDYYAGITDELSGLNAMIGAGEAAQENLKEQYLREAMTTLLTGTGGSLYEGEQAETLARLHEEYTALEAAFQDASEEEKITLGEKADSLKSQAEALAEGAFGASDKMQEVRDVELDLISAIRENTKALGEAAYLGDYEKQQELSKGRGLNGNVTADSSYRSLRERDFGPHAYGLDYVPYDNFPALLHQGERVLTASQARAADRGMGVNVTFSGPVTVREEADLDRLAAKLAANVVRAAELGV